jgi:hypothetical protein
MFGGYGVPPSGGREGAARPVRRVNPVGGVIAPRPSGETHTTPSGHTYTMSTPASRTRREPLDPDDPWRVAEGVRPVIEPRPEPRHDPPPGVFGIDR